MQFAIITSKLWMACALHIMSAFDYSLIHMVPQSTVSRVKLPAVLAVNAIYRTARRARMQYSLTHCYITDGCSQGEPTSQTTLASVRTEG